MSGDPLTWTHLGPSQRPLCRVAPKSPPDPPVMEELAHTSRPLSQPLWCARAQHGPLAQLQTLGWSPHVEATLTASLVCESTAWLPHPAPDPGMTADRGWRRRQSLSMASWGLLAGRLQELGVLLAQGSVQGSQPQSMLGPPWSSEEPAQAPPRTFCGHLQARRPGPRAP